MIDNVGSKPIYPISVLRIPKTPTANIKINTLFEFFIKNTSTPLSLLINAFGNVIIKWYY